jgi:hypothetical protein
MSRKIEPLDGMCAASGAALVARAVRSLFSALLKLYQRLELADHLPCFAAFGSCFLSCPAMLVVSLGLTLWSAALPPCICQCL